MTELQTLFDQGMAAFHTGNFQVALSVFAKIVKGHPKVADAHFLMGVSLFQLNRLPEARQALTQAVTLAPDYDDFWFNYGMVLKGMSLWGEAEVAFQKALKLSPDFIEAKAEWLLCLKEQERWPLLFQEVKKLPYFESPDLLLYYVTSSLKTSVEPDSGWLDFLAQVKVRYADKVGLAGQIGQVFLENHLVAEAEYVLEWALKLSPEHPVLLGDLATCLLYRQSFDKAKAYLEQALLQTPENESLQYNLIQTIAFSRELEPLTPLLNRQFQEAQYQELIFELAFELYARKAYQIAIALFKHAQTYFPKRSEIDLYLGVSFADEQEEELSQNYYQKAIQKAKHNPQLKAFYQLISVFSLPHIHTSLSDLKERFQKIEDGMADLKTYKGSKGLQHIVFPGKLFLMAYHDYDMKPVMETLGQLWSVPEYIPLISQGEKIKVGFVSEYFKNHSVSHCYQGVIQALCDDPSFEVTVVMTGKESDATTKYYQDMVDHFLNLETDTQAVEHLRAQGLDALIYLDIGMSQINYQLACHRLAPLQATFAGHPVTTGIPNMDYFISSEHLRTPEVEAHHSEEVVFLNTSVTAYKRPILPEVLKSKSELGLDESANNYVCPMTLFKVHPDFDFAVAEILRRDPKGKVYFFESKDARWGAQLMERFKREIPDVVDRIVFLAWTPKSDFLQILALSDVVLDTFYFGAGNTSYLTLGVGNAILTWPARYTRGRHTYGHWKRLGLDDGVASSPEDYIEKAVKIATDKPYQNTLREKIKQNNDVLFGNYTGVDDFKNWLKAAAPSKRAEWQAKALLKK